MTNRMVMSGRVAAAIVAVVLACTAFGCGGRQTPPSTGTCHPGREWVPPQQVDGQWRDGYCRSTGG